MVKEVRTVATFEGGRDADWEVIKEGKEDRGVQSHLLEGLLY